ncbi:MAG: hypothetical protein AAFQ66_10120, partial [Pseudomonadota bacterium]
MTETRKSTPDGSSERLPYLAIFGHHAPPFGWHALTPQNPILSTTRGQDQRTVRNSDIRPSIVIFANRILGRTRFRTNEVVLSFVSTDLVLRARIE